MRRTRAYNGETIIERDLSQLYCVKLNEEHAFEAMQLIDELEKMDEVEFAEPNYILHTLEDVTIEGITGANPLSGSQWYLQDYGVTQLWTKPIINHTRPVIAIIDTGVDMTHPDLKDNLWTNAGEVNGENGYDNDGNGFKNDLHGWDFINNTPNVRDFNMHGTHVAGIAAAANNNIGIIGANPCALIMPVSVMQSDGSGDVATIIKGINYAVQNGATVLNLSLGTYANSSALRQALQNAYSTTIIVAAAGNDGRPIYPDCPSLIPAAPVFPAAYSFVLGVQAITDTGSLASFSNYDCDGPNYSAVSSLQDPDGFNYELKAPGTNMFSTIPGGKYKTLKGTSMAAPLVAGAVSFLKMVKNYDSQEILWGDLLHTDNIAQAYAVTNRPAELDLIKIMYRERKELADETEEDYSNDGEIDAGETVSLYPVIRTTFGAASNIKMKLEMGDEFEDPNTVEILTPDWVDFGLHLDAYGKGVSLNPLQLRIASNVADNRHIKMKFTAKCDETNTLYIGTITLVVNNMVKISGLISEDKVLTSDHVYHIIDDVAVVENATLTIEPGTRIEFGNGKKMSVFGNIIAIGTPEKKISFTLHNTAEYIRGIFSEGWSNQGTFRYCIFDNVAYLGDGNGASRGFTFDNCIIRNNYDREIFNCPSIEKCNYTGDIYRLNGIAHYSNLVNFNYTGSHILRHIDINNLQSSNSFNCINKYQISAYYDTPTVVHPNYPSYLGSSREDFIRPRIYEMGNGGGYGWIDLDNMLTTPVEEAHGIVWKVVVDGKDAQDEYEDLAPLGVGKHKFEVYFNRPMNKEVAPQISFGVRDPYTQNAVAEDGSWNEEGTIYTAYKTITGKTKSDGVNRIYVYGAEDNEYFECPYEKTRFNIMINAAGSMATGFAAEAGLGRVNLTWDNSHNNFDDAMGYNIYRYELDDEGNMVNNTCLNQEIVDIETMSYADYDVVPGTTYYYMYKVLSTDLQEYDVSNVVAATPLTATKGDANGSGDVDVADVVSTVNYVVGIEQKPFIFEAADMNNDLTIDVLDVIGIVQAVLHPSSSRAAIENVPEVVYTIEDGILYVENPVTLAGLQLQLSLNEDPVITDDMKGFELASVWLTDSDYLLLAYSFGSKTLEPGKHAVLKLGNGELKSLRLSDTQGRLVRIVSGESTLIKDPMGSRVMNTKGVYNLNGQKMTGNADAKLRKGVYIINGQKIVK